MRSDNLKLNKFAIVAFRSLLSVLCLFYIWDKLNSDSPARLIEQIGSLKLPEWTLFTLIIILLPVNWGIEALKWKLVNRGRVNTDESYRGVLMGVALGFLIPARFGDVMGRLWSYRGNRSNGVSNALIAGGSQFIITMVFGSIALLAVAILGVPRGWSWMGYEVAAVALILSAFGVIALFKADRMISWVRRRQLLPRLTRSIEKVEVPSNGIIFSLLGWSVLRYVVFSSQFALALVMFGYSGSAILLFTLICVYYFLSSLIPTSILGKLGIRESLAMFIFAAFMPSAYNVVGATVLIWIVNLAVPAAIGSLVMVRSRSNVSVR